MDVDIDKTRANELAAGVDQFAALRPRDCGAGAYLLDPAFSDDDPAVFDESFGRMHRTVLDADGTCAHNPAR
jgi:hypothetical protein